MLLHHFLLIFFGDFQAKDVGDDAAFIFGDEFDGEGADGNAAFGFAIVKIDFAFCFIKLRPVIRPGDIAVGVAATFSNGKEDGEVGGRWRDGDAVTTVNFVDGMVRIPFDLDGFGETAGNLRFGVTTFYGECVNL